MERLYDTTEAAAALRMSIDDVRLEIRAGKLHARKRVVRGKGKCPRYVLTESDLQAYLDSLAPAGPKPKAARKPKRLDPVLAGELATCVDYFAGQS